jgi:predicted phage tail protein
MTLIIQKPTGAKLNLRKGWQPMDADAAAYIAAVETADTEPLEEKTKIAIDNFVLGCKADGIWSAIKASCILAGARTLTGALVPLAGTAPTNVSNLFVSGDYNRKTGLLGNGTTKYLNSNRANNADPQNSKHISIYFGQTYTYPDVGGSPIGADTTVAGRTEIEATPTVFNARANGSTVLAAAWPVGNAFGFVGASRSNSTQLTARVLGFMATGSSASSAPTSASLFVYRRNHTAPQAVAARLAFYSIGEALDLARLDSRVTDLINAFGAAIP